jgi:glyoxylate reductase
VEAQSGAFDGIVAAYHAGTSKITGRFDEEVLTVMPTSLKFICHGGAGYDSIDVAACSAHHIQVSNIPESANEATADTAIFLMLGALRGFNAHMTTLRDGLFSGPSPAFGHDPRGKTLGILGMGAIGRNVAKKALAFGMKIQYHNRKPLSSELSGGAIYVTFDELLLTSDVLSLNLPLNVNAFSTTLDEVNY